MVIDKIGLILIDILIREQRVAINKNHFYDARMSFIKKLFCSITTKYREIVLKVFRCAHSKYTTGHVDCADCTITTMKS